MDEARNRVRGRGLRIVKPFVPAFEIVRLRDGFKRASSVFIMADVGVITAVQALALGTGA
jgi:hypothetical protein